MAIQVGDLGVGKTYPPPADLVRVNRAQRRYRQYIGRFATRDYQEERVPSHVPDHIKVNWYRRIAQFYPEFMLSDRPDITVPSNARANELVQGISPHLFSALSYVNTDMLRYGTGVLASSPADPLSFVAVEAHRWFPVEDAMGRRIGDYIVQFLGHAPNATYQGYVPADRVVVTYYPFDGEGSWTAHKFTGSSIGEILQEETLPPRMGRQVIPMHHGYVTIDEGLSIYEDIEESVEELAKTYSGLSRDLEMNRSPILAVPQEVYDAVFASDSGQTRGPRSDMVISLQEGDEKPAYIQYDMAINAVKQNILFHEHVIFDMTGLSKIMFGEYERTGAVTGAALRRLALPFTAKLGYLREINRAGIQDAVMMYLRNLAANGGEVIPIQPQDVVVDFKYEEIFRDGETDTSPTGDGSGDPSERDGDLSLDQ